MKQAYHWFKNQKNHTQERKLYTNLTFKYQYKNISKKNVILHLKVAQRYSSVSRVFNIRKSSHVVHHIKISTKEGLPWWRNGWESACQCRAHGFEPWPGKIPHAAEQLGPCATTTEPALLEPVLRNKRGRDGERPAHRDEEWLPLSATRESPRTETKTQHSQKLINKLIKKTKTKKQLIFKKKKNLQKKKNSILSIDAMGLFDKIQPSHMLNSTW